MLTLEQSIDSRCGDSGIFYTNLLCFGVRPMRNNHTRNMKIYVVWP